MKWNKNAPSAMVRRRARDKVTQLPDVKGEAKNFKKPLEIWY